MNKNDRLRKYICIEVPTDNGAYLEIEKELIPCEECIHFGGYYCHNPAWGDGHGSYPPPIKEYDGFCDWAAREDTEV